MATAIPTWRNTCTACSESSAATSVPELAVEEFESASNEVLVDYRSNAEVYGRLAFSRFPYLDFRLDGESVDFFRFAMGTLN